jgi:uncharacterized protein (TIGR02996 family)
MSDEAAFLAKIQAMPTDHTTRLVYADWLEEQADQMSQYKAEYLRLEQALAEREEPPIQGVVDVLVMDVQEASKRVPHVWLMQVARLPVQGCGRWFRFQCPKRWELMTPTDHVDVRLCTSCQREVHFCFSRTEAVLAAWAGHCVAIREQVHLGLTNVDLPGSAFPDEIILGSIAMPVEPEPLPKRNFWQSLRDRLRRK